MKFNKGLLKGDLILLVAFGIFNFLHFLFQLFMARMLSISDYGILATLFSIIYILSVLTESIQIIIAKYSAGAVDNGKLKDLLKRSFGKALYPSLFLFVIYILLAIPLSYVLKIDFLLLLFSSMIIFLAIFIPINRGIMQGRERFRSLSLNMIVEASIKLVIGILFVYLGFRVYGAITGVLFGGFFALLLSFVQLTDIIKFKRTKMETPDIYGYAKPAFIITAITVIFYSLDIIIAKIFFPSEIAGYYALSSILGKIIFWGTLPIGKAMFPMSASKSLEKDKSKNLFLNAFGTVIFCILAALVMFYVFSGPIIKIFSGRVISESASILFYVGIAFSFISITNLILLYKLSLGKVNRYLNLFIFIIIEILLLSYFSKNLLQYSIAFMTASAIFLWGVV